MVPLEDPDSGSHYAVKKPYYVEEEDEPFDYLGAQMTLHGTSLDPADPQKWGVIVDFLREIKRDVDQLEKKIDQKFEIISTQRTKEAYDRGGVNERLNALDAKTEAQSDKMDKLVLWLLGVTAGTAIQLAVSLLSRVK